MNKLTHADVEVVEDQISFKGFYQLNTVALRHKLFLGGWSKTVSRELFKRHDAVGVLLYDPLLDAVALVEQFRIGVFGSDVARKNHQSPWISGTGRRFNRQRRSSGRGCKKRVI